MICCLNPHCQNPLNADDATVCHSCGATLTLILRGRYRAVQPIGQGGFGRTYLALDEDRMGVQCVIKQFSPQVQGTKSLEKAVRLFNQEAVRLYELGEHAQIPTLLAYFEQDRYLYLVQQFIEGHNLLQELKQKGPFSESRIRDLLNDLLPVLRFIHQHQVIHRDITPMNILRRKSDDRLVLIDFGVAKQINEETEPQPGTKIGTEGYSPIEQLRSGQAYPASDLYSIGATCIHLMTQVKPESLYDPLRGCWIWRDYLRKKGVEVSDQLADILEKLLKDLVHERYQSADEVMRDLHADYFRPASPFKAASAMSSSGRAGGLRSPTGRPASRSQSAPVPSSSPRSGSSSREQPPAHNVSGYPPSSPPKSSPGAASGAPTSRSPISRTPVSRPGGVAGSGRCAMVLMGHTSWVTCVAISNRTAVLASSSLDDTVNVWNSETGELLLTLKGHTRPVNAIAISPHGKTLVSASDDYTLKMWNLQTGALMSTLTGHARDVNAVAISPDGQFLFSGGEDRTIKVWQMGSGTLLRTLFGVAGMIKSIAVSPNGQYLASGGLDNKIKLWNLQTGEQTRSWTGHLNSVNAIAIAADNRTLVSGSKDKTVKLWNLETGELLQTFSDHIRDVQAVAISPDGTTVVSGSSDTTIKLWNVRTGQMIETLTDHADVVNAVAISSDGRLLVSGSSDKTVRLWPMLSP